MGGIKELKEPHDWRMDRENEDSKLNKVIEGLTGILQHKEVRAYLWHLLEISSIYSESHHPGDPFTSAHNDGKKVLGRKLLLEIEAADPKAYERMKLEHIARTKQRKGEKDA